MTRKWFLGLFLSVASLAIGQTQEEAAADAFKAYCTEAIRTFNAAGPDLVLTSTGGMYDAVATTREYYLTENIMAARRWVNEQDVYQFLDETITKRVLSIDTDKLKQQAFALALRKLLTLPARGNTWYRYVSMLTDSLIDARTAEPILLYTAINQLKEKKTESQIHTLAGRLLSSLTELEKMSSLSESAVVSEAGQETSDSRPIMDVTDLFRQTEWKLMGQKSSEYRSIRAQLVALARVKQ